MTNWYLPGQPVSVDKSQKAFLPQANVTLHDNSACNLEEPRNWRVK